MSWSAIVSSLAVIGSILLVRRIMKLYTLSEIPGPPSESWILGHGRQRQEAPVGTLYNKWAREYGPTYKLKGPFGVRELYAR